MESPHWISLERALLNWIICCFCGAFSPWAALNVIPAYLLISSGSAVLDHREGERAGAWQCCPCGLEMVRMGLCVHSLTWAGFHLPRRRKEKQGVLKCIFIINKMFFTLCFFCLTGWQMKCLIFSWCGITARWRYEKAFSSAMAQGTVPPAKPCKVWNVLKRKPGNKKGFSLALKPSKSEMLMASLQSLLSLSSSLVTSKGTCGHLRFGESTCSS